MDSSQVSEARFRSGAVARMLGMPVATLRVWERRYAVCSPELTASGQRLYSSADVERLALLKRLTDLGHAISRLAPLAMAELHSVAATHASTLAAAVPPAPGAHVSPSPQAEPMPGLRPWRVVVIGTALAARLHRPGVLGRLGRALEAVGPFETPEAAAAALAGLPRPDAVLSDLPVLTLERWQAQQAALAGLPSLKGVPHALLYGFAATLDCEQLSRQGVALLRAPQPDAALAHWLRQVLAGAPQASEAGPQPGDALSCTPADPPPRRWPDAALVDFAGLSSTVACECPRHIAELLLQLSHFEAYCAECENRSPADAQLHHHLWQVTARARASFEAALETLARHEGLLLPGGPAGASIAFTQPQS